MEQMLYGVAIAVIGWLAKTVDKLNDTVTALSLDISKNYMSKSDCEKHRKEMQ